VRVFTAWSASALPRIREVGVDWRVLGFALGVSVVSGILFGLAPAVRMARGRDWPTISPERRRRARAAPRAGSTTP